MYKIFLTGTLCCILSISFAQTTPIDGAETSYDQRLLNHYSVDELNDLQANNTEKFTTIHYYYTQSYIIEKTECFECGETDFTKFDIVPFERFRKKSERFTREFDKYGFRLTLLSIEELEYKLPIHTNTP